MAEGKWISDLTANTPLADAARLALAVRLEVVRDCLQHALHQAETVAAVRAPSADHAGRTLLDLARPLLANLLRDLDTAAGQDLDDYAHLHQVRIAGKRLRYAMEVFGECFAPPFREELYPAVE